MIRSTLWGQVRRLMYYFTLRWKTAIHTKNSQSTESGGLCPSAIAMLWYFVIAGFSLGQMISPSILVFAFFSLLLSIDFLFRAACTISLQSSDVLFVDEERGLPWPSKVPQLPLQSASLLLGPLLKATEASASTSRREKNASLMMH